MHRVSELIGKPLLSADTGVRLGRVSDAPPAGRATSRNAWVAVAVLPSTIDAILRTDAMS